MINGRVDKTYVLSHDHVGSDLSEHLSHDADLLGGNVVDVDEEALGVLGTSFLGVLPNLVLSCLLDVGTWHI